jgi:AraC-like DNA-binding protein
MPFQHTLLMGPVIYFYVQSLLNPHFSFTKKLSWHLLPSILFIIWNIVVAVTDRIILKKYYLMNGQQDPDFETWYVAVGLVSLLVYLYLSLTYYRNYRKFIVQEFSFADTVSFRWVRNFLVACFIYFLSSLFLGLLDVLGVPIQYTDSWWYYFLFAIIFYYIGINGYNNAIENKAIYTLDFLKHTQPKQLLAPSVNEAPLVEDITFEEIEKETIEKETFEEKQVTTHWKEKINTIVIGEKLYQNPTLTLTDLAKKVNTNPSVLSKIINQSFEMNFNDFINYHRVEEVKEKLQEPNNAHLTIMSIAYDAGFNSKATFNRAFKKLTGKNPKEFVAA